LIKKNKGVPIRTTFEEEYTKNFVTQLQPFLERIKRTIHHIGLKEVVELRLKTKEFEYLLRTDNLCSFIVVQRHGKLKNEIDE
jgi:predicted RNA-binding protein